MKIHSLRLLFVLSAIAAVAIFFAGAGTPATSDEDIRKAEYIFLEAANARADDRADDYLMLLRAANRLNPDDPFIAGSLAEVRLAVGGDSATAEEAYAKLKERFEADPTEPAYYNAVANVASQLNRADDLVDLWSRLDTLLPDKTDPAIYLASALLARYVERKDSADYLRACAIYDRLEKASGPTLPLISLKVRAYNVTDDTTAIYSALHRLAVEAPRDTRSNIYIGNVFEYLEKPDSALFYYNRAEAADPDDGDVYVARAKFFHAQNDSVAYDREVFRVLNSATLEFPQKLEFLADYAVKLYKDSTQYPRIESMFQTMQEQNPGEAGLHALYGAYKAETGDLAAAAEQFSYSLDLDPNQHDVWVDLMQVTASANNPKALYPYAVRAMEIFPDDYYFILMGAASLAADSLYDDAIALLDKADPVKSPSRQALSSLHGAKADYLYASGNTADAVKEYETAIEYNAENFMAMNNCAYFMALDTLELDKAELYASIASSGDPTNPTFLDTYTWVLFMEKKYPKAREAMDKALAIYGLTAVPGIDADPDETPSAEIFDHAGDIYFMTGDSVDAVEFWKKALELTPDDARIRKKVEHKAIFFD